MKEDLIMFIGFIVTLLAAILISAGIIIGVTIASSHYNSYILTKAGYPNKIIGLTCFAYYGNRWVSCSSVLGNQVELVKHESP